MPIAGYLEMDESHSRLAPRHELAISICMNDGHVQQAYNHANEDLISLVYSRYQPTYSMSEHVQEYMNSFLGQAIKLSAVQPGDTVVEIGSNDGKLLESIKSKGFLAVGFEPASSLASVARDRGLQVVNDYFGVESSLRFLENNSPVQLVVSRHTLEHAFIPLDFLRGIEIILDTHGLAAIEIPYLQLQMTNGHYEAMTFQHMSFFTVTSMIQALALAGLALVDVDFVDMDGGSMIIYAQKRNNVRNNRSTRLINILEFEKALKLDTPEGYELFFSKIATNRNLIKNYFSRIADKGISVMAYGAGSKGQSLLNMLDLDSEQIKYVIDDVPGNAGRYVPGTGIQVISSTDARARHADIIFLTAPTHIREIMRKESRRFAQGTRFVATVPDFHFLESPKVSGVINELL